jgi:hypothetical protein
MVILFIGGIVMNGFKKRMSIILTIILFTTAMTGCTNKTGDEPQSTAETNKSTGVSQGEKGKEEIVATINDSPIYLYEAKVYLFDSVVQLMVDYGQFRERYLTDGDKDRKIGDLLKEIALNNAIRNKIVCSIAEERGIKVEKELVDTLTERSKQTFDGLKGSSFIEKYSLTLEQIEQFNLRKQIEQKVLQEELKVQKIGVEEERLFDNIYEKWKVNYDIKINSHIWNDVQVVFE